jgi:polysaccharide biosynthesis protein PslG
MRNTRTCSIIAAWLFLGLSAFGQTTYAVAPNHFGVAAHGSSNIARVFNGSIRLWDTGTAWADINTAPGVYDFSKLDRFLSSAGSHGLSVLYTFGHTPRWASSDPTNTVCLGQGTCAPPKDVNWDGSGSDAIWKAFVYAVVQHGGSKIAYYEMWNEAFYRGYWIGTLAQLMRMQNDAISIIHTLNPQAQIISVPMSVAFKSYQTFAGNYFAAGGGNVDAIAIHRYGFTFPMTCSSTIDASIIVRDVAALRSIMAAHGLSAKPVWHTEGAWGDANALCFTDQTKQATFLAQWQTYMISAQVGRDYWYAVDDPRRGRLYDGSLLVPGQVYNRIVQWTQGATFSVPCPIDAQGTLSCHLSRPGYEALLVFNPKGSATFDVPAQYTQTRSLFNGNPSALTNHHLLVGPAATLVETNSAF